MASRAGRRVVSRTLRVLDVSVQALCIVASGGIALAVIGQVFARYLVSGSTPWLTEVATYSFVWLTMLAIALGVHRQRHLALDIWEHLPGAIRIKRLVQLIATLIVVSTLLWLAYLSVSIVTAASHRLSPALKIPYSYVALALPTGFGLCVIFLLGNIILLGLEGKATKEFLDRTELLASADQSEEPEGV